jgi:hypothetical protein
LFRTLNKTLFDKITILHILAAGLLFRLLAAFFSEGYAFSDDHFEVIELVQKWRDGVSFNWTGGEVHTFSLIYPGIHYLLFFLSDALGITEPKNIVLVTRLFHALVSMLSVYYSFLLTWRLTNNHQTAKLVAVIFALFWIFPFFSVRNLREFFCIPFLMMGSYYISAVPLGARSVLISAFFFAMAICIRLQVVFIPAGIGLVLLLYRQTFKMALLFGIGTILFFILIQGGFDYIHYGDMLASTRAYFIYNSNPANIASYPQGPWHLYMGTVLGITVGFPFLLLLTGYFYSIRISRTFLMLFAGSILFFVFHSYYSNKQERFILPFIPFFLLLGITGFIEFYKSKYLKKWMAGVTRFIVIWFIILNSTGLLILSFTYTKRTRVEAMNYLKQRGDVRSLVLESESEFPMLPFFYLGKRIPYITLNNTTSIDSLKNFLQNPSYPVPDYVIMYGQSNFEKRVSRLRILFPGIKQEAVIQPGFVDNLAFLLNPEHNENERMYIFRIYEQ